MNVCCVKITIGMAREYNHVEDVIYYHGSCSPDFISKWMWYFEYLQALVKVRWPHRRVVLTTGIRDVPIGDEWHEMKRQSLIKSKTSRLKRLDREGYDADLFGFAAEDHEALLRKIKHDLELLEIDEYHIPEFPEYINKIKEYI